MHRFRLFCHAVRCSEFMADSPGRVDVTQRTPALTTARTSCSSLFRAELREHLPHEVLHLCSQLLRLYLGPLGLRVDFLRSLGANSLVTRQAAPAVERLVLQVDDFLGSLMHELNHGLCVPRFLFHAGFDQSHFSKVLRDLVDGCFHAFHVLVVCSQRVLDGVSPLHRVVVFVWLLMFLGSYIAIRD